MYLRESTLFQLDGGESDHGDRRTEYQRAADIRAVRHLEENETIKVIQDSTDTFDHSRHVR